MKDVPERLGSSEADETTLGGRSRDWMFAHPRTAGAAIVVLGGMSAALAWTIWPSQVVWTVPLLASSMANRFVQLVRDRHARRGVRPLDLGEV